MNLEKLTKNEKIEKLEYPSYEVLTKISELTETLIKESMKNKQKANEPKLDEYTQSAAHLGKALLSLKTLYKDNKIDIGYRKLLSDGALKYLIKNTLPKTSKEEAPKEIISNAAKSLIEGIETELSQLPDYQKRYSSKELETTIKQSLENVKRYAELCSELGEVMIKLNDEKGFLLKGIMTEYLINTKDLFKKIKEKKSDQTLSNVLTAHAALEGLTFNKNVYPFKHKQGEQIYLTMHIAKEILDLKHEINEAKISDGKPFMYLTRDERIYKQEYSKFLKKGEKDNGLANLIGHLIFEDPRIHNMIREHEIKSPFSDLDEQLNTLGIEYRLAKEIAEYLSINVIDREITNDKIKIDDHYKSLARNKEHNEYANAVKLLVEKVIGKKIPHFSLKYFSHKEASLANAISAWIAVTKVKKNGKIKTIYEEHSQKNLDSLFEEIKKQFTNPDYEICIKDNIGVCFIFDKDIGYTPKVNFKSLIEVQDDYEHIRKADELAARLYMTEVIAHETTHASQINSKLTWRTIATDLVKILADIFLEKNKEGKLDYQEYLSDLAIVIKNKKLRNKGTVREGLLEALKIYSVQALGIGKFAEKCKEVGVYDAICNIKGLEPLVDGGLNMKPFDKTKLEESKAATLVKKTMEAIKNHDVKKIYKLREEAEEYCEELRTITETMAEVFGHTCTRDFIEHYPEKLSKEKKEYYADSLKNRLIREGANAKYIADTIYKHKKQPETMEKELNEKGYTYQREISKYAHQRPVEERLIELGYNPLDPFEAYENIEELKEKASEKGYKLKEVLYPVNNGQAIISLRYRKNIPTFLKIVEKYGPEKAHDIMLNAESLKELEGLVKE